MEALGEPVFVADLGITVSQHGTWIDQDAYAKSDCLRALLRIGSVRVSLGGRSRVSKKPPKRRLPTSVARSRPGGKGSGPQAPLTPTVGNVTAMEAHTMAAQAANLAAERAVTALLPTIKTILANQTQADQHSDLDTRIEQAVARALGGASLTTTPSKAMYVPIAGPEEPVFIPSGIVKNDTETLSVQSDSTQSGGLDDAASALKALRKGMGGDK